jgi:predicted acetyltransferase
MTVRYQLRAITPDEFEAYCEVPTQAFNDAAVSAEGVEHERLVFEFDRSLAAFDGDTMVGTTAAYTFQLTVPGAIAAAAGVTFVGVLPTHRRRGILSAMMHQQLADIVERGEAIAALYASEAPIYGRYGYGPASSQLKHTIMRGEGTLTAAAAGSAALGGVRLRGGSPPDLVADMGKVHAAAVPRRPGMLARDERWWRAMVNDPQVYRSGMSAQKCLLAEDDSGPLGYALYRTKPDWGGDGLPSGKVAIREFIAGDTAAAAALWTDLLTRDLVGEVTAYQRPVDDPLLDMLADRRRARSRLTDGLWVRLTDVPAALTQRGYASAADVVIEVTDDVLPANAGRWRLQCPGPGEGGKVTCERTSAAADVALPVSALGAGYLGGTRLAGLVTAGIVTEHKPGAAARLSAALYSDPAPWSPSIF